MAPTALGVPREPISQPLSFPLTPVRRAAAGRVEGADDPEGEEGRWSVEEDPSSVWEATGGVVAAGEVSSDAVATDVVAADVVAADAVSVDVRVAGARCRIVW